MSSFWVDRPPLFLHRVPLGGSFHGDRFATIDEGDELTVISAQGGPGAAGPYVCITLGPFDLGLVGIMAKASAALATAGIPVFVISTFRFDHILVPLDRGEEAMGALAAAGFVRKG